MTQKRQFVLYPHNILILNPDAAEAEHLSRLCRSLGQVSTALTLEKAITLIEAINFHLAVVDSSLGTYSRLRGLFLRTTSIIITGRDESQIREIIRGWPQNRYLDFVAFPLPAENGQGFLRTLTKAAEHSQLINEVQALQRAIESNEVELHEAFSQIKDIKGFINDSVVKEVEKRLAIESQYILYRKEKLRIEDILKRIYAANDVTSLIDVVHDVKDIVKAQGVSLYVFEEDATHGRYLKPLVWDDAVLSHPDFAKHIVPLDAQDFAASAAYFGREINTTDFTFDRRLSRRYSEYLHSPLKSLLSVPVMHDRQVIGVLEVYNKTHEGQIVKKGFTKDDQQILRALSEHMSIAITKLNLIQYDPLTGLLRPDPFFVRVIQKLESESKRREESRLFALVMGDVDWFKNYNDRHGHEAGNKLLRELAAILKASIREEDLLCRYGGEEFLFFLTNIKTREEAPGFTERIRRNVEERHFDYQEFQPRNNLTMSFGITAFTKQRFASPASISKEELKTLVNEADMALLEAKGETEAKEDVQAAEDKALPPKNRTSVFRSDGEEQQALEKKHQTKPSEQRRHPRLYVSVLLLYREQGSQKVTRTVNLSVGGARIRTRGELPSDKQLEFMLILDENACQCRGDVVYSMQETVDQRTYSGIKFAELPPADQGTLEGFIDSLRRGKGASRPA